MAYVQMYCVALSSKQLGCAVIGFSWPEKIEVIAKSTNIPLWSEWILSRNGVMPEGAAVLCAPCLDPMSYHSNLFFVLAIEDNISPVTEANAITVSEGYMPNYVTLVKETDVAWLSCSQCSLDARGIAQTLIFYSCMYCKWRSMSSYGTEYVMSLGFWSQKQTS
eukprot:10791144-Ditylum_brightwellii.AAC.2